MSDQGSTNTRNRLSGEPAIRMQSHDPEHPWLIHASYWLGEGYAALGLCDTALGYFESVLWSDVELEPIWRDAAKANIDRLNADDGAICDTW